MSQAKLQTDKYKTVSALKKDIELLFNNAQQYNLPDSQVYLDAVFLLVRYSALLASNHRRCHDTDILFQNMFHRKYEDLKKSSTESTAGSRTISLRVNEGRAGESSAADKAGPADLPIPSDAGLQTNGAGVVKRGPGRPRKSGGGKYEKGAPTVPQGVTQGATVTTEDGSRHDGEYSWLLDLSTSRPFLI